MSLVLHTDFRVVPEHSNPVSSTWTDPLSARHLRPTTKYALGCNHGHSPRQVRSIHRTPILRLAGRLRPCHKAWRQSRRHNLEPPMVILRTATASGHRRRFPSHLVGRRQDRPRMYNREAAATGPIRSIRIRTQHRRCGSVSDNAYISVLLVGTSRAGLYIGFS